MELITAIAIISIEIYTLNNKRLLKRYAIRICSFIALFLHFSSLFGKQEGSTLDEINVMFIYHAIRRFVILFHVRYILYIAL